MKEAYERESAEIETILEEIEAKKVTTYPLSLLLVSSTQEEIGNAEAAAEEASKRLTERAAELEQREATLG